jgi:hypothetical protein
VNEGFGANTPDPSPSAGSGSPDGAPRNPGFFALGQPVTIGTTSATAAGPGLRCAPSGLRGYAAIFCSSAISASGAVTFGEWLASIS